MAAFPQQFGAVQAFPQQFGNAASTALALDAADGVIDGKFNGRPIVQAGAQPAFATQQFAAPVAYGARAVPTASFGNFAAPTAYPAQFGSAASSALALDAADGVIDGKFNGRPIVQAGASPIAQPFVGGYSAVQPAAFATQQFAAQPIQQFAAQPAFAAQQFAGVQQFAAQPVQQFAAQPAFATQQFAAQPAFATQQFAAQPAFATQQFAAQPAFAAQQFGAVAGFQPGSQAAALDAADGVIDGKFNGRPIVQAGAAPRGIPQAF